MTELEDFEEEASEADDLARVKRQRDSLARQLFDVKHKHADYLETVWSAVTEAMGRIDIKPVRKPTLRQGKGKTEVAVPLLSDIQMGKLTPDYNSEVAHDRVIGYAHKIIELTAVQRSDHPVNECVVAGLGDLLENCDIFPGQQWLIDSTLYRQVFQTTPTAIVEFLRILLAHFDTVRVESVDGNHGRIGRKGQFGPEDNADKMIMRLVELMLHDEPRITFNTTDYSGERSWYRIMQIGNYKALLIHGDQIRGANGYPWYGLGKKVHSWGSGGLGADSDFQDVMLGHYHQLACVPLNHRFAWANGSTESTNTFASEMLAAQSRPGQWLLYVDPEDGDVTASYKVRLS